MDKNAIEQLIIQSASAPNATNLTKLYNELEKYPDEIKNLTDQLAVLFEALDAENLDALTANFIIAIASLNIDNSPKIRLLLSNAVIAMLPPFLNRAPITKALGLRDTNVPPSNVIGRFRKLTALKNGQILFMNNTGRWGSVSNIDTIAGSVAVNQFGAMTSSAASSIPLDLVLVSGIIFNSGLEIIKIAEQSNRYKLTSKEFKNLATSKSVTPLTEAHLEHIAQFGCGHNMSPENFKTWWNNSEATSSVAKTRRSCDGRSIKEIILLIDNEDSSVKFDEEEITAFINFFEKLKRDFIIRDLKGVAEVIVKISERVDAEDLEDILTPLMDKTPFWPNDPLRASYDSLSVWSELAAKDISKLANITFKAFHGSYIAGLSMRLPLKALNSLTALAPLEELDEIIKEQHSCSTDLTLWIWKNRKKSSKSILGHVNIDNIIRALSQEHLPKAWTASRRELHNLLMDNAEFQKYLITCSGDPLKLTAALQGALFLSPGERQSLIVKLARSSKELQSHLEGGAGQKILKAGLSEKEQEENDNSVEEPTYTSIQSHKKLMQELDDIIKIHKPENREALKTARAHGDFRENSEFDAAKERRNFLSRRQGELERDLMFIQPVDLRKVTVDSVAVIGSKVTLKNEDGTTEVQYLLGAWDGNPEKSYLSYKTRLGAEIYNREVGTKVTKPNKTFAVIEKVEAIEEEVLKDLD